MAIDWKSRMLEATASLKSRDAAQRVVEAAVHSGARLDDVQRFAAQQPALQAISELFADGFGDASAVSRKTNDTLGGDVRSARPNTSAGLRLHTLRASPDAALPWFSRVTAALAAPLTGTGADVVVDGERFSPADIAALLRAA
jgi:hypothetical protein